MWSLPSRSSVFVGKLDTKQSNKMVTSKPGRGSLSAKVVRWRGLIVCKKSNNIRMAQEEANQGKSGIWWSWSGTGTGSCKAVRHREETGFYSKCSKNQLKGENVIYFSRSCSCCCMENPLGCRKRLERGWGRYSGLNCFFQLTSFYSRFVVVCLTAPGLSCNLRNLL